MENILDNIINDKKKEVQLLKQKFSISDFENMEFYKNECLCIKKYLVKDNDISIIAEIKKASPSKGVIRENFNHIEIAKEYFSAGADAISIFTDEKYFQGRIDFLMDIAKFKQKPLLRKDFIISEYQIYQAKAYGADSILLICEVLSISQIKELTLLAKSLGMNVLLELHSVKQLNKIDFSVNDIIGVNNRDLTTFVTDINVCCEVFKHLPEGIIKVAESGIFTKDDVKKVFDFGANAILVGEAIMREKNLVEKINSLRIK